MGTLVQMFFLHIIGKHLGNSKVPVSGGCGRVPRDQSRGPISAFDRPLRPLCPNMWEANPKGPRCLLYLIGIVKSLSQANQWS